MPTLLEFWREQNRDRDGEPSSLLINHEALRRMQQDANYLRLRKFAQSAPAREMGEAMRVVAERLMGRKRPISTDQPDKPKPKPGVGRPPSFTPSEIERGIQILRELGKMPVDAACKTLEEAGIKGKRGAVYSLIWKPAYGSR